MQITSEDTLLFSNQETKVEMLEQHSLSTSPFHLISQLAQLGLHLIAMVALNLDHAILDGASGAA